MKTFYIDADQKDESGLPVFLEYGFEIRTMDWADDYPGGWHRAKIKVPGFPPITAHETPEPDSCGVEIYGTRLTSLPQTRAAIFALAELGSIVTEQSSSDEEHMQILHGVARVVSATVESIMFFYGYPPVPGK